jgi:hypothetical protein
VHVYLPEDDQDPPVGICSELFWYESRITKLPGLIFRALLDDGGNQERVKISQ